LLGVALPEGWPTPVREAADRGLEGIRVLAAREPGRGP
jgi:hypothetical protein